MPWTQQIRMHNRTHHRTQGVVFGWISQHQPRYRLFVRCTAICMSHGWTLHTTSLVWDIGSRPRRRCQGYRCYSRVPVYERSSQGVRRHLSELCIGAVKHSIHNTIHKVRLAVSSTSDVHEAYQPRWANNMVVNMQLMNGIIIDDTSLMLMTQQ